MRHASLSQDNLHQPHELRAFQQHLKQQQQPPDFHASHSHARCCPSEMHSRSRGAKRIQSDGTWVRRKKTNETKNGKEDATEGGNVAWSCHGAVNGKRSEMQHDCHVDHQAVSADLAIGFCFSGNAETEDCDGVADCRRQGGRLRANPEEHWVLENFLLDCGAKNPMIRVKQGGKRGAVNTALLRCRIFSTSLRRILSSHLRNVETAVG